MNRRSAAILCIWIMALLLPCARAWSQNASGRPGMLRDLAQSSKQDLPARATAAARAHPKDSADTALDLVFYRWAAARCGFAVDIPNVDAVIFELSRALSDSVVNWASDMFVVAGNAAAPVRLPPHEDERVGPVSDLRREFGRALEFRDSSPVAAVEALVRAQELCRTLRLNLSEALVLKSLADQYHYSMSRYGDAERCYSSAIMIFGPYGCSQAVAAAHDDYGRLNERLGMPSAAAANYTAAAQQWLGLSTQGPDRLMYLGKAGIEYVRAGFAQAGSSSTGAVELMNTGLNHLFNAAHPSKQYGDFIDQSVLVAQFLRQRGSTAQAIDLLDKKTKKAALEQADPLLLASVYRGLADCYSAAAKPANAAEAQRKRVESLEQALGLGEDSARKLERAVPVAGKDRVAAVRSCESAARAAQELERFAVSADLWSRLAAVHAKAAEVQEQAQCLRYAAYALDAQGKHAESLQARLEAAVAVRSINKTLARDIGMEMVSALVEAGDLTNALEAFRELVPIFQQSGDVRGAAGILEGRGSLLAQAGNHRDAASDLKSARDAYLNEASDPWAAGHASLKLAASHSALGEAAESQAVLDSALSEIEKRYGRENPDADAKSARSVLLMELYRQLAAAHVKAGDTQEASTLLAKARRHPFFADLVKALAADPDAAVAQWAATGLDITSGTNSTALRPNSNRIWGDTWTSFWNACLTLKSQHRAAYSSMPVDPLALLKANGGVPRDSVVVTYTVTPNSTFAFVVGAGQFICREIGGGSGVLEPHITRLRSALKTFEDSMKTGIRVSSDWSNADFLLVREPLTGLYTHLLAPLAEDVAGKRIILALPEELSGLPMHALIVSDSAGTPKFLIENSDISYLAPGMLADLVGRDSRMVDVSSDRLAIFADPDGSLPGAREEARVVRGAYFNSQWYEGDRATATNFLRECERAGVVHVAAHHVIDSNPSRFELRLASDAQSDGVLTVEELSKLASSNIGLLVLSACDSISSSDPISSGPSRAAEMFSTMGVRSVLGGLWKVSDEASVELMGAFYRNLSKGQSRTEALRRAQTLMIQSDKFAHPFYWACFALYGNPR